MSRVRRAFLRLGLVVVLAGSMVAAGVLSDRAPVFAQAQVPGYPVSQSAAIGTGGGGPVIYGLTGQNVCSVDVSGTWSGTLSVQGSTQWASVQVTPLNSSTAQTGISANGVFIANVGGLNQVRVTGPAGSGSATVYLTCFFAPGFSTLAKAVTLVSPLPLPVSVSAPTDGAGNVKMNCEVGCGGATATATPFATLAPNVLQVGGSSSALTQTTSGALVVTGGVTIPSPLQVSGSSGVLSQNTSGALIGAYAYPNSTASAIPTAAATFLPGAHLMLTAAFTNGNAATAYCGLYDAASVAIGTVPTDSAAVPAGQTQPVYFPPTIGKPYKTNVLTFCATTINGSAALTSINLTATYY